MCLGMSLFELMLSRSGTFRLLGASLGTIFGFPLVDATLLRRTSSFLASLMVAGRLEMDSCCFLV